MSQAELRQVTIRFPQVDPAGIVFYPRYFEMVFRHFPTVPMSTPPYSIKTQFLKPNRLGDIVSIEYVPGGDEWSVTGRMNNERHFSIQAFDTDGELAPDAHLPEMPAFKTRSRTVGAWTCGVDGRMSLSRYFESLNMAIEEWFEDTLDLPFHELHVGRRVGIPTVQFNTRVAALPEAGANASIWIRPVKVGGRAMTFCSWLVSEGRCLVENEQVVVFVRMLDEGYETMPIPDTIRESFESRLVAAGV